MKTKLLTLTLVIFSFLAAQAQNIRGTIFNAENGEPLPYVNVYYEGLNKGTVSNIDGRFSMPIPTGLSPDANIIVSHIGFDQLIISVAEARDKSPLKLNLKPTEEVLTEAIVIDFKPKEILKRMKENLPNNMYPSSYESEIFYREFVWANDIPQGFARMQGYLFAEGFDERHAQKKSQSGNHYQFTTYKNAEKCNYKLITNGFGRPRGSIASWGLMESLIYRLWDFKLSWFNYELRGSQLIGDRPVFVLKINAKNSGVKGRASKWGKSHYGLLEDATLYIDQEDYGVHFMKLSQNYDTDVEWNKYVRHYHQKDARSATVKYHRTDEGKYIFSYANYSNSYHDYGYDTEKDPDTLHVDEYAEMYATNWEAKEMTTEELRAKYIYGVRGEKPMRSLMYHYDLYNEWIFAPGKIIYDQAFWKDYNYPEHPQDAVFERYLSQEEPLEAQYQKFSNEQYYLLPILRKRHGLKEYVWEVKSR